MAENLKCDVLITYRNREEHLRRLVPELRKHLNCKITVIEQCNDFKFYKSILYNVGIKHTEQEIMVLSDVDYVPMSETIYYDGISDLFLPVKFVKFVKNDMTERKLEEIPAGYIRFLNSVDDDFYGGVLTFRRDALLKINGFNPLYFGWGLEDADIAKRAKYYELKITRNQKDTGGFYALEHSDNNPGISDSYFRWNADIFNSFSSRLEMGLDSFEAELEFSNNKQDEFQVDTWIQVHSAEVI